MLKKTLTIVPFRKQGSIDKEQICQQLVSLITAATIAENHNDRSTSNRIFINTPSITLDISNECEDSDRF